ncbi:uncharacterized protein LOC111902376 [Lactuca sativa]|uniref:Uncharacterized protein n=1 Tax=Lactuca sativa TaxID=4236 RepID=A0A9R1W2G9_LACSA|nr:uncharacterized protein LOC111902376 [Lactuca sativa]XP_023753988.1 uncharacterized protein LOC111902376 [Lactuca sativa]KAJ0214991.1 hypothetical protein LSAT_V11C300132740 [Lactuca sativa]
MQICSINSSIAPLHASFVHQNSLTLHHFPSLVGLSTQNSQLRIHRSIKRYSIQCSVEETKPVSLRTCKQCKTQFDPSLNHPQACRFHTAHFGGETKRKFESVYSGGTMNTPESGKVFQYWHCCGSEDPFDIGCTASPHSSYDD